MDATEQPAKARSRAVDYAKKYWWASAIAVPLLVALIAKWPFGPGETGPKLISQTITTTIGSKVNSDNTTTNNTITIAGSNFALPDKLSIALSDPNMNAMAQRAAQRLQNGDFAGAAKLLEELPEHDRNAAVWTLLGVAYAGAGVRDRAAEALKRAGDGSTASQAAKINLATLAAVAPADAKPLEVSQKTKDPNNPFDSAVEIPLSKVVAGEIAKGSDFNIYAFTAPPTYRDWIDIRIVNKSNQLTPQVTLFGADKVDISGVQTAKNAGADLVYTFVAGPNVQYYVKVTSLWGQSSGPYQLTIKPRRAYDAYESNDDIRHPYPDFIPIGTTIHAGIMDGHDIDFYHIKTDNAGNLVVSLENQSSELQPWIGVYDQDRTLIAEAAANNQAANVSKKFSALAHSVYYIEVTAVFSQSAGDYALTIRPE